VYQKLVSYLVNLVLYLVYPPLALHLIIVYTQACTIFHLVLYSKACILACILSRAHTESHFHLSFPQHPNIQLSDYHLLPPPQPSNHSHPAHNQHEHTLHICNTSWSLSLYILFSLIPLYLSIFPVSSSLISILHTSHKSWVAIPMHPLARSPVTKVLSFLVQLARRITHPNPPA